MTGDNDDLVLSSLLEIAFYSLVNGRPLFANPLDEPAFYRKYFYRWVREGLEEVKAHMASAKAGGAASHPPLSDVEGN